MNSFINYFKKDMNPMLQMMSGKQLFEVIKRLWPLNRSITGSGTLQTLKIIESLLPGFKIIKFSSGESCFDWEIPVEWNVSSAFIIDPNGVKIVDFLENNSPGINRFVNYQVILHHRKIVLAAVGTE